MRRRRSGVGVGATVSFAIACSFANAASTSTIYRCVENEVVTYSDRPCGSYASEYEANEARISILEVVPPSVTMAARPKQKRAKAAAVSIAAAQAKHSENCAKLERSVRDIRAKMRAGYNASEGERLKDRQRKISAKQRELRC